MRVRAEGNLELSKGERWFAGSMVVLAVLCWVTAFACRTQPALNIEPYRSPLFDEHFPDLLLFRDRFRLFHSTGFFTFQSIHPVMYPAPVAVVYEVFYLLAGNHPVWLFLALVFGVFATAGTLFARGLMRRGMSRWHAVSFTAIVLTTCYPIWFELKQANMEVVVWVLIASGVALLLSEHDLFASICFSLAAGMKIYPAVFLCLLLLRKRYREILIGVGVAAVVGVFSLWLECPSIRYSSRETNANLGLFRKLVMLRLVPQADMDHSLFCFFKRMLRPLPGPEPLGHMLTIYLALSALAGFVCFFGVLRRMPLANQIFGLTILCILLPPTSFEYTLQHLLTPAAVLLLLDVEARARGGSLRGIRPVLICLTVLLGAIPEFIHHGFRLDGTVKTVLLVVLMGICLRIPFVVEPTALAEQRFAR